MRTWIVILGLAVALFAGCATKQKKRAPIPPPPAPPVMRIGPQSRALAQPEVAKPEAKPDKPEKEDRTTLLVRRRGPDAEVENFHRQHGRKVKRLKHTKWHIVEVGDKNAEELFQAYQKSGLFDVVQWNKIYTVERNPNDPLFAQQWDMQKIQAPLAWDIQTTNDVIVAVIDTGVDYQHPDLRDNLWTGPQGEHGYTCTNGVVIPGGAEVHYHGTHVAGTIGATGNNGIGVAGINWRTRIMSLQFIQAFGSGSSRDAGLLIEKMVDLRQQGVNLRVSNNSWGALGQDPFLEDQFDAAGQAGILNVCAAGNNAVDTDDIPFTPASAAVESIVSVLASDQNDGKAHFSNFGIETTDLLAPGTVIWSTRPGNQYWALQGTSMASPHVAGAVAMLWHINPNLTPSQAKTILLESESYDRTAYVLNSTGGGRLNLRKLWSNPHILNPPPPNHPPVLTLNQPPLVSTPPGTLMVSARATDPDGDPLGFNTTVTAPQFDDNWLAEVLFGRSFPTYSSTNSYALVTTLAMATDQRVDVRFGVSDGKGGSARAKQTVWTYRDESKVRDLRAGIINFTTRFDAQKRFVYRLDVNTNIVRHGSIYGIEVTPQSSPWGPCCEVPNHDVVSQISFPAAGPYSVRPYLMDTDGNFTTGPQSVIVVSNSNLRAPMVRINLNTRRGKAPLEIVADLSQSTLGSIQRAVYGERLRNTSSFSIDVFNPKRVFTITEPGIYEYEFSVSDIQLPLWDKVVEFITVLPAQEQPVQLLLEPWGEVLGLTVYSSPGAVLQLQQSSDLRTWATFRTITNVSGSDIVAVGREAAHRFIRALR